MFIEPASSKDSPRSSGAKNEGLAWIRGPENVALRWSALVLTLVAINIRPRWSQSATWLRPKPRYVIGVICGLFLSYFDEVAAGVADIETG